VITDLTAYRLARDRERVAVAVAQVNHTLATLDAMTPRPRPKLEAVRSSRDETTADGALPLGGRGSAQEGM